MTSLLAAAPEPKLSLHGPAFASSADRAIVPLVSTERIADYFDVLDSNKISFIQNAFAAARDKVAFPVRSNDTLVVAGLRTADLESRQYLLRRSGQFIQLRLTCSEHNYCLNDRAGGVGGRVLANEGDTLAACYYFKQVK